MNELKHIYFAHKNDHIKLGWKPDEKDERDYTTEHEDVAELFDLIRAVPTARKVDLTPNLPGPNGHPTLIFNQTTLGSCTDNAQDWTACYNEAKFNRGKYTIGSRLFLYWVTRHLVEGTSGDCGATIRDTVQAFNQFGMPPETSYPYNVDIFEQKPPTNIFKEALKCKAVKYIRLNNLNDIINTINAGLPVNYGTTLYDNLLDESGNMINTADWKYPKSKKARAIGGHALPAAGYDKDKKKIKSPNSWDYDYGDEGCIELDMKYFDKGDASDYWVILQTSYIPTLTEKLKEYA